MGLAARLLNMPVSEEAVPCLPLQPAALRDRSGGLGCECLIVQLVPGMLVLKSIFSKEPNLYMRSLTRPDLCDQPGTRA